MMNLTPEQAKKAEGTAVELATRVVLGQRAFETWAMMRGITSHDEELMDEAIKMQGALKTCFARDPESHRTAMVTAMAMLMSAKTIMQADIMEMGGYTLEEVGLKMMARVAEIEKGSVFNE